MLKSNASLLSGAPDSPVFNPLWIMKRIALLVFIAFITGCASVHVTPRTIREVPGRQKDAGVALASLAQAVAIANEFLKSDFRKTLPAGRLTLSDTGIVFKTKDRDLPLDIRCCPAGDILIPFHMVAQERASGFVVGLVKPRQHRVIDNSLFLQTNGERLPDYAIAELILHELTHCYYRLGTVSLARGIRYYAEAIFLFRYRNHSMERLPFRTSSEFEAFVVDQFSRRHA